MIRYPRALFLAATVASVSFAAPAFADVTADEIGNRLARMMAEEGITLGWDTIDGSASDFTIKGAKIKPGDSDAAVTVGDVQLTNVVELEGGDYKVGKLVFPSMTMSRDGTVISMRGAVTEGQLLAGPNSTDPLAGKMVADRAHLDEVTMTKDGFELFKISNFSYEIERSNNGRDISYTGGAEKFFSDFSKIPEPQTVAALSALQLLPMQGSMQTSGTWSMDSGKADLTKLDVTFDNQGKMGLTASLGGYTPEFLKGMAEARKLSLSGTPEQQQAQGLATLGLMQQITVSSASIRYDDASFAMRALEMAAATQNARASDLPGTAQMLLPMVLPQYLPPEMAQQVTTELVKFLRDPKNIEIRLSPAQPVPLMSLYGAAADPQATARALGLSVVANQ